MKHRLCSIIFRPFPGWNRTNNRLDQARAQKQTGALSDLELQDSALLSSLEKDRPLVENILARQISLTLAESGIYNPFANWLKITFPTRLF